MDGDPDVLQLVAARILAVVLAHRYGRVLMAEDLDAAFWGRIRSVFAGLGCFLLRRLERG